MLLFLIITFVTFVIFFMAPQDPARAQCGGDQASRACLELATEKLEGLVGGLRPSEPSRLLLSNADGAAVSSGQEALTRLVTQVTSPVRFDTCLSTMRELGVTAVLELPPAGALAGLAKREWKGAGIEILALTSPADLDRARELLGGGRD